MASGDPKSPMPFDPGALIEAQRRNFEAFTNAGPIVADGMRTVAERQAAMVQEAMQDLWGEIRTAGASGGGGARAQQPADQVERMRAAFEKMAGQVQEMSGVLMKAHGEAMGVLNACAASNMESLGKMAPDLVAMQKAATEAVQNATAQVSTAVEEMRRRMAALEGETRDATGKAAGAAAAPARATASAAKSGGRAKA